MKMRKFILITLLCALVVFACDDKEEPTADDPKTQSTTITGLFDNDSSATVTGYFTNAEWDGVPGKIKTALDILFTAPAVQAMFRSWLNKDITIIVEKTSEYTNYKTIGDGKTMHLNCNT